MNIVVKDNSALIDSVIVNDISGKTVFTALLKNTVAQIDLSAIAKGVYIVKVKSEGLEKVIRILKE